MRKILFLDIDGVLNSFQHKGNTRQDPVYDLLGSQVAGISKILGLRLKELLDICPTIEVVLTSHWKIDYFIEARVGFERLGIKQIIKSRTPITNHFRGLEIDAWLTRYGDEPIRYAILDDEANILIQQAPALFQTHIKYGLTENLVDELIMFFAEEHPNYEQGVYK